MIQKISFEFSLTLKFRTKSFKLSIKSTLISLITHIQILYVTTKLKTSTTKIDIQKFWT